LLKHCVRAVAPATEFGKAVGQASQLVPFQNLPALQVMFMVQLHAVPVQAPQFGQLLVAPPEQVLARACVPEQVLVP